MEAYAHQGTVDQQQAVMADDHREETARHEKERDPQEQLKQRHHAKMAHLVMLRAAIKELP